MATSNFKRAAQTATTSGIVVYTAPAVTNNTSVGLIMGLIAANTGTSATTVDVFVRITGSPNVDRYVIKNAPVPVGGTLSVLDGKIVIEAQEQIHASSPGSVDVTCSVLEIAT
tara:strand:- start:288 stop:626 length:339 start_codon:yes stop_codon:yes gene_type:complete